MFAPRWELGTLSRMERLRGYEQVAWPCKLRFPPASPTCLVSHGTTTAAPPRLVLVWDLSSNRTRIFTTPRAQAAVSPDCRRLAYCNAAADRFVIVDISSPFPDPSSPAHGGDIGGAGGGFSRKAGSPAAAAKEKWRWPDAARHSGFVSFGQFDSLSGVRVFEFSADGKMLVVGDGSGGVGVLPRRGGQAGV
ncbi:hypothetical protein C7999DRAFT_33027 [Corynascus novoguineensis]|uniref:Uncharacterized protein n=1 Tax=Corynascus novoguineensis TaxID=1126955 RepID=A0AAN7CRH4_9PEZI|nr:hypothetical protein C7999DRAFT_33027 [Corynascus novoguineensis]